MQISKKLFVSAIIFSFISGAVFAYFFPSAFALNPIGIVSTELRGKGYRYISPLLECDISDVNISKIPRGGVIKTLETSLEADIENLVSEGKLKRASVYFRDLNNGPIMRIRSDENYSAASLLKIAIMMTAYKKAESDPGVMDKCVYFKDEISKMNIRTDLATQELGLKAYDFKSGKCYKLEELIDIMITESDNSAKNMAFSLFDENDYTRTIDELGIQINKNDQGDDLVSSIGMAAFFRVLYNSTYLKEATSENALGKMIRAHFKSGIAAGVPSGIEVANKFGDRSFMNESQRQLHDCGIVYFPGNPYILCVMTEGESFEDQKEIIKNISAKTYEAMSRIFK